ncbi:hypothetical protein EV643_103355 [Kribbella sp. VKM Ac-2527]|uniref:Uncharacterized protein n=1 Tax=Kribbella caucasensis TaxID=2512215 RepID=A0A4R6KLF6_9ACTN|nr:hypothetical protein EV643_103355 [Kribbella sp. VKM Ac-2527]
MVPETWLVTGRPRLPWEPLAERHARRAGDYFTLCGLAAPDWPLFSDLDFEPDDHRSCKGCARGALERRYARSRR